MQGLFFGILSFISSEAITLLSWQRLSHCLVPGGKLMLTVGGSAHPCFEDTMFGELFFYDSYPPEAVLAILQDLNFQPLIAEFMNLPTPDRDKGRYAIVARKL